NTINYWGLDELYGLDELNISYTVIQDCIDNIDYEYDSIITLEQEYFDWDYIKFPVETAFRTMGDCEDQAILTSAYLESCGIETAIAISHDPAHPTRGAFYHGTLFVQVEDPIAFWSLYPTTYLWSIDGINAWCWVDTTWDVPFGSTPDWLQEYLDYNINFFSWDIITLSFCDIGGSAYTNTGENIGLTCVMPT
ncbi:MAG TPA: transglutaminase-like domain-containing protein, partial [Candidatus Paceibacterota bacterium]|nr:transglutaminase-like domain-containing protein [Candidatus Paceibacterota bacterium]